MHGTPTTVSSMSYEVLRIHIALFLPSKSGRARMIHEAAHGGDHGEENNSRHLGPSN